MPARALVGAARCELRRREPAERLPRGRGRVARGERDGLAAIRRRDEPRRAPRLAARGGERHAELGPRRGAQPAVHEAPALQPRVRAGAQVQRLAGLERFDGEAAVVLAGADLLLGQLEELVVDRGQPFAGMRLKRRIEVERRPGAGDVETVAARLVERRDGAQHRALCARERRQQLRRGIQPEGRRRLVVAYAVSRREAASSMRRSGRRQTSRRQGGRRPPWRPDDR